MKPFLILRARGRVGVLVVREDRRAGPFFFAFTLGDLLVAVWTASRGHAGHRT
jgi:hypothetical protein